MPACPYGCGVNHRVAPSTTNCRNYLRSSTIVAVKSSELTSGGAWQTTPKISREAREANRKLERLDVNLSLSEHERQQLITETAALDEDYADDEDYFDEMSDNELLDHHVSCLTAASPYVSVCGESVNYIRTENENSSLIINRHVGRQLAEVVFKNRPDLFRGTKEAESFVSREFGNWTDSETFSSTKSEGLPRTMTAYDRKTNTFINYDEEELHSEYDTLVRARCEALVRAQYRATQRQLSRLGIHEIEVYRGVSWTRNSKLDSVRTPASWIGRFGAMEDTAYNDSDFSVSEEKVSLPLFERSRVASFSTSREMATQFALTRGEYAVQPQEEAVVFRTTVQAKDVLALPSTGCAIYSEDEIIVSGDADQMFHCEAELFKRGS